MAYVIKESGRWQSFKSDFLEIPRIGVQDEKLEIPQTLSQQSPLETILENTRLSSFDLCTYQLKPRPPPPRAKVGIWLDIITNLSKLPPYWGILTGKTPTQVGKPF